MCLRHNTQQTLTRGLRVQDSPCSQDVMLRLSQQKLDIGGLFRIFHISLGMGWGWDFLLHLRNSQRYLKGRFKTYTENEGQKDWGGLLGLLYIQLNYCCVFLRFLLHIVFETLSVSYCVFIMKAQFLTLTLPFIWSI